MSKAPMRNAVMMVPIDEVCPAEYNPRETDQLRLAFLTLSLQKLGFILPLYMTPDGHLLSGHQRILAARTLGCTHVPVVKIDAKERKVRNINLIFNRATNDMKRKDTSDSLWEGMTLEAMQPLLDRVPDKDPNSPEFYRCLEPAEVEISTLCEQANEPYEAAAASQCMKLLAHHVVMPCVRSTSGRIVNGVFRVMAAGEFDGRKNGKLGGTYPTVDITDDEAEIAERLLNMISMRFTVQKQYADVLRFGSFRRPANIVYDVPAAIRYWADHERWVSPQETLKDAPGFWNRFRQIYGEQCLDFGAGQRRTEDIITRKGIQCASFEPYPVDWKNECSPEGEGNHREPCVKLARKLSDNFLEKVATGYVFDSIFSVAVLNSVPFNFDRMVVLSIIHSLCSFHSGYYGSVRSVESKERFMTVDANRVGLDGKLGIASATFSLDYEENITLGDISTMPKVQKFHYKDEIAALLGVFWENVRVDESGAYMPYRCLQPKRRNNSVLKTALLHEFNLPYRDGDSINRHNEALEAFGERFKIDFSKIVEAPRPENAA